MNANDNEIKVTPVKEKKKVGKHFLRKVFPALCATALAVSTMAVGACAIDGDGVASVALATINKDDVVGTMMPFVNAGIPLLAVVGGLKLGKGFLKSCMH